MSDAAEKRLNTEQFKASLDPKAAAKGKEEIQKKAAALKTLTVEYIDTMTIQPNPWNPNRQNPHDFQLLLKSIEEDGFTQPVVVCKLTQDHLADPKLAGYKVGTIMIVDGEHRWRAAQHFKMEQTPVVFVPQSVAQMRIATLRHNRARGSEDLELSAQVLKDLRDLGELDWAADSLMMDDVELDKLLNDIPAPDGLAGEQFSEAWAPDKTGATGDVGSAHSVDGTPAALLQAREQEARIAAAKTEEERAAAMRDSNVYRLALMFSGEEATEVKKALGDKPAERVLAWARASLGTPPKT